MQGKPSGFARDEGIPGKDSHSLIWDTAKRRKRSTHRNGFSSLLTQGVGDACLHVVSADMTDPILMLWLGKDHYANVPEGMDGNLVVVVVEDDVATQG